jgi:hypothetical protein
MPFQTTALVDPSPGLEGGWASINPHTSMLNPNNGDPTISAYSSWKVGATGAIIGRFCFCDTTTGLVTSAHPGTSTVRVGFLHRYHPVLIPAYLGQAYTSLYAGQEADPADAGDFWVRIAAGSGPGPALYATIADGSAVAAAAAGTTTFSATTTNTSPNLTAVGAGAFAGQPISGTGIPANTYLVSVNSVAGTAVMSANATASGTITVTATTTILTRWYVDSLSPAGGLSKMSTRG